MVQSLINGLKQESAKNNEIQLKQDETELRLNKCKEELLRLQTTHNEFIVKSNTQLNEYKRTSLYVNNLIEENNKLKALLLQNKMRR